jgi:hypothetical protein
LKESHALLFLQETQTYSACISFLCGAAGRMELFLLCNFNPSEFAASNQAVNWHTKSVRASPQYR